ncbi:hypothetical protein F5Y05DRAFT_412554 [Hypoxylon sp. FL0543]|nr:hypothetical protein F5Y05DRAFT_412554 [Hypoxylon sp. FL0543]
MTSLYDLTVPVLTRALQTEVTILKKAEEYAKESGKPIADLINARIYPDMFPLSMQVVICEIVTKQALQSLGGKEFKPDLKEISLEECYARLADTLSQLAEVKPEDVNGKESQIVELGIAKGRTNITAVDWYYVNRFLFSIFDSFRPTIQRYLIPTVYFHLTTLYDILRKEGVPLGKRDYLTHFVEGWEFKY